MVKLGIYGLKNTPNQLNLLAMFLDTMKAPVNTDQKIKAIFSKIQMKRALKLSDNYKSNRVKRKAQVGIILYYCRFEMY